MERILEHCALQPELQVFGMLFLLAYAFCLRLPSEALPVVKGIGEGQARLFREGEHIVLVLRRRCV